MQEHEKEKCWRSVCVVKISLPVTVSVDGLIKLFEKELPQVREVNPHIISGPKFDGILEFQNDKMIIGISVEASLQSNKEQKEK